MVCTSHTALAFVFTDRAHWWPAVEQSPSNNAQAHAPPLSTLHPPHHPRRSTVRKGTLLPLIPHKLLATSYATQAQSPVLRNSRPQPNTLFLIHNIIATLPHPLFQHRSRPVLMLALPVVAMALLLSRSRHQTSQLAIRGSRRHSVETPMSSRRRRCHRHFSFQTAC